MSFSEKISSRAAVSLTAGTLLLLLSCVALTGCGKTKTSDSTTAATSTANTTTTTTTTTTATNTTKETSTTSTTTDVASDSDEKPAETASTKSLETTENGEKLSALGKKVLTSEKWIGQTKMAYIAAQRVPEIAEKVFCYCGCDYTDEHVSLLDCFTSDHGVDCNYCKGEVVMAYKMSKKGSSVADIQKAVDLNWGPKYPFFEQPSPAIKKYWKTRLWAPGVGPTPAEKHNDETPLYDPFTGTMDKNSAPMSKSEDCCGKKDKAVEAAKQ